MVLSPLGGIVGIRPLLLAGGGAIVIVGLALLKSLHITFRAGRFNPLLLLQALVVISVYHLARAFALIGRARHHRNR